jgi:YfiH family protein
MIVADELSGGKARHGFFGRQGGVSSGIYASLNCGLGSRDDPHSVTTNRMRVREALNMPSAALVTCYQVHGRDVATVTEAWTPDRSPRVDGMVTKQPGILLGILTADCAPVLFRDPVSGVIGAAHAGWKGAQAGILEATVDAMQALGANARDIIAVIGPCIGQASYEVGPEFPQPFIEQDAANTRFFVSGHRAGRFMFDLGGYAKARLERRGLGRVERFDHDTCGDEERFFSYRRATLRGEPDYGREISVIGLAS